MSNEAERVQAPEEGTVDLPPESNEEELPDDDEEEVSEPLDGEEPAA